MYVHHVRKPTYTGRNKALETLFDRLKHQLTADERNGRPAEHLVRADGLLSHVLAQVHWLSTCVIFICSSTSCQYRPKGYHHH